MMARNASVFSVVVLIACANQGLTQDQPAACNDSVSYGIITKTSSVSVDGTLGDPVPICIRCGALEGLTVNLHTDTNNVEYEDSNGYAIVNNTNGIIISEYGLLINDPASTFTDGESIVCAFNDGTNDLEYQITFDILIFNSPPITPNVSVLDIAEGENTNLTCIGDPDIDTDRYQWLLPDGTKFPEHLTVADKGLVLELNSITRAKSGVYVCSGKLIGNIMLTTKISNITVNVQYPARLLSALSPAGDSTLTVGSILSLNCTFEGNPVPSVLWNHNGTELTISTSDPNYSETIIHGHYALLDVTFATIEVSGDYACGVNNSLGEDQAKNTSIIVQVAPGPVYSLVNTSSTQTCISLNWTFGFDGNSPITGVDISYKATNNSNSAHSGSNSTDTKEQTTITVCNLQPSASYEFTVTVRNEVSDTVGVSSPRTVSADTRKIPIDHGQFMLRLVDDGNDNCSGRLEIKPADSSVYEQACGLDVRDNEAMVICRQLNCTTEGAKKVDGKSATIPPSIMYSAFNYTCNSGNERNITECEKTNSTCVKGNTDYVIAIKCAARGAMVQCPLTIVLMLTVAAVSLLLVITNMDIISETSL